MCAWNTIEVVDCLEGLKQMQDKCVQCCITSPPYWSQRDYGIAGQYGLEATPELYIENLTNVFAEVKRVLRDDGTLWLNLGDAYWGSGKAGNNAAYQQRHTEFGKPSTRQLSFGKPTNKRHPLFKPKDLMGLPWRVAFALQEQRWYLRQDIIWQKLNSMPESTKDRCTRSHEYLFMFSKSMKYYYDAKAIGTVILPRSMERMRRGIGANHKYSKGAPGQVVQGIARARIKQADCKKPATATELGRIVNRRSIWTVSYKAFKGKHFAAFPLEIPTLCIKAASRENDLILDPFMGAGTTALAAAQLNRFFNGFDINPEYVQLAKNRLREQLGMFYITGK